MNPDNRRLAGRSAVITGCVRGIGRAIAELFAQHGANVLMADIDGQAATLAARDVAERHGVNAIAFTVDVACARQNQAMVEHAISHFGTLDILLCNAGIVRPARPLEDISAADWQQMIDINLMGCIHASSAFIPHAKANGYGKVIYMASVAGQVGGVAAEITYSVTKAGVLCLTKALAKQLGPWNITVNAIAPGTVETAMTDVLQYSPEVMKAIPLGRYGNVEDIAAAALYLASDDAGYVTGATLDVNGGLAMR